MRAPSFSWRRVLGDPPPGVWLPTSLPHTPAASTLSSAESGPTSGSGNSRSSVASGPTCTAASACAAWRVGRSELRDKRVFELSLAPAGIVGQIHLGRANVAALAARSDRVAALGHVADGFEQQSPHLDDGRVGAAEVLLSAIVDRAHALLNGEVLRVGALDAGVVDRSLALATQAVVVGGIGLQLERARCVVLGQAAAHLVLHPLPLFVGEGTRVAEVE